MASPSPYTFRPPNVPPGPPTAEQLKGVLGHIPAAGISIDDLCIKLFGGTVPGHVKAEVIRGLDAIATLDAATGLWKARPRHNLIPGQVVKVISKPRTRKRVRPFSSTWISGTGEMITYVQGDYNPVWQRHHLRGLVSKHPNPCYKNVCIQLLLHSSPALFAFLDKHKTVTTCSTRDCLTCSLADLAAESMKPVTFTFDRFANAFHDLCEKVFWGPRARAKRRVGPITLSSGGLDFSFLSFLLYNMREQLVKYPRCVS